MVSLLESTGANVQNITLRRLRQVVDALGISLLETYRRAGLLDTENERDQDALAVAQLVAQMTEKQRRRALEAVRSIAEEKD